MTITIVQKPIKFSDGTTANGNFAYDGTNLFPITLLLDENGTVLTDDSSTGLTIKGSVIEQPFRPIPASTMAVTASATATGAGKLPLAAANVIPVGNAVSYRVRNAAGSSSPITWILTTDATKIAILAVPYANDGTGGVLGDKTVDPGDVEIVSLSVAQQTALAAGTLYISAITPSGGSGILYITPGIGA